MSEEQPPEILAAQALAELVLFYPEWCEMQGMRPSLTARKRFFREVHEACTEHPLSNARAQYILMKTIEAHITATNLNEFLRMRRGMQGLN